MLLSNYQSSDRNAWFLVYGHPIANSSPTGGPWIIAAQAIPEKVTPQNLKTHQQIVIEVKQCMQAIAKEVFISLLYYIYSV